MAVDMTDKEWGWWQRAMLKSRLEQAVLAVIGEDVNHDEFIDECNAAWDRINEGYDKAGGRK